MLRKKNNLNIIWLSILITSFFICIPLGRFSFAGFASDFRIYDYVAILFLAFNWGYLRRYIKILNLNTNWFTYYARWLIIIVFISIFFSILNRGLDYLAPTLIRALRFALYFASGSFVIAIVKDEKKFRFITWVLFLNILTQAVLAFLQGFNLLGSFWPKYWLVAYKVENVPVGTLSPHHKHIAVIMLLGISLALGLFRGSRSSIIKALMIPSIFIMIIVPLFPATKTFIFSLFGVIIGYFYINKLKGLPIIILISAISISVATYTSLSTIDRIEENLDNRLLRYVDNWDFSKITTGRDKVYYHVFDAIANHPYILITGTGFQAISQFIPATGAHNNFLQFLVETGIFGFVVFLFFLKQIHKNLILAIKSASSRFEKEIIKHIWVGYVSVLFTLFTGEVLYGQYSMFTLPGQVIMFFGLGVSLLFWKIVKYAVQNNK